MLVQCTLYRVACHHSPIHRLVALQDAIRDYDAVVRLDSSNVHAFHNRGISYDKLGYFERAVKDFNQVLKLEPTNSVAYFNRGSTFDNMGHHDEAVADYARALELDNSGPNQDGAGMASQWGT